MRREMADYLHGHVQSKLLALSLSLGMCRQALDRDPTGASQMLERVQTELQKVQDEDLRQVSRELYPAIIKFGLVPAMRSLVSRFNESVEIDLTIDPRIGALDLAGEAGIPEKQRLGVYRIAEEALNNILKHADATNVRLSLDWQEPEHLTMSVVDNGRGFDGGKARPSVRQPRPGDDDRLRAGDGRESRDYLLSRAGHFSAAGFVSGQLGNGDSLGNQVELNFLLSYAFIRLLLRSVCPRYCCPVNPSDRPKPFRPAGPRP